MRRATWLRNAFDRLFQQRITDPCQSVIHRRRARYNVDADLALCEERVLPGEVATTARITQQMTEFPLKHYRTGVAERAGNTKTYGLLKAKFNIDPSLPGELRAGLFETSDRATAPGCVSAAPGLW